MSIQDTTKLIKQWAFDRNLASAEPTKQALKLGEEFGELCQGLAKGNRDLIIDSIGDMYVVMTILSMQLNIDIEECVKIAYNEIKDRKGKMINGVFVKESDLRNDDNALWKMSVDMETYDVSSMYPTLIVNKEVTEEIREKIKREYEAFSSDGSIVTVNDSIFVLKKEDFEK